MDESREAAAGSVTASSPYVRFYVAVTFRGDGVSYWLCVRVNRAGPPSVRVAKSELGTLNEGEREAWVSAGWGGVSP